MKYTELVDYLDGYLRIAEIADYGPQGLQVEADNPTVRRVALAVDTAPAIIEAAATWGADMLLVHHGVLWRNVERLAGPLGQRVRGLIHSKMHLYAAHLALDAHPEVGNNAVLADMLGVPISGWWCEIMGTKIGVVGALEDKREQLLARVNALLATEARLLAHGPQEVRRLAIVSGAGADQAGEAQAMGADTLLTGETSHAHYWSAADHQLNVIFAGHYATETVGVKALGRHLAQRFELATRFFDFPTAM